jgi:phospholipase C
MDRLDSVGRPWKIYGAVQGQTGYGVWDICPTFAECLHTSQDNNLVPNSQFLTDASSGNLPDFSVVTPGGSNFVDSCHNNTSMTACDNWIGQLVTAAMTGPEWGSTAVFLTFDDSGNFYDQVPPPVEPDGLQEGPRVPLIVISPYARAGFTDTTPATFEGILSYVESTFGLAPLSAQDQSAYPFTGMFDYSQAPLAPVHMVTRPISAQARAQAKNPPASLTHDPS